MDHLMSSVESGDHLHWACVSGAPDYLIRRLTEYADLRREAGQPLYDVHISHLYTEGYADYVLPEYADTFRLESFFVGGNVRKATQQGFADYIPCSLSDTSRLVRSGVCRCDGVLLMVSEPDEEGFVSLGTSVDYMPAAIERARYAVVQINKHVPFCYGDGVLKLTDDGIIRRDGSLLPARIVHHDQPLAEAAPQPLSDTDIAIGRNVASLIPDGATLQIGIGNIPTAVLAQLHDHKHLGVHSEMFTDDVIPLVEEGVIDGSMKKTDPGKLVAMFLKGGKKLYDFVDRNKQVELRDVWYTNNPAVIAQNPKAVAINSAIEVDLTGQVCADSMGHRIFSGSGGQLDFMLGASYSDGGIPIIAMPSMTGKGVSKLVVSLTKGAGVVTPRTVVRWVVTEYGAVNLWGCAAEERARRLISIAHPSVREELAKAWAEK